MKKYCFVGILSILTLCLICSGVTQADSNIHNWSNSFLKQKIKDSVLLENINEIILDGSTATVSTNSVTLNNIRIKSNITDLDDYISIDFLINLKSLQLIPQRIEIINDIGVYYKEDDLFTKDIVEDIHMVTPTATKLSSDSLHSISVTKDDEYQVSLETGTVLFLRMKDPTDDYELQIDKPDGSVSIRSLIKKGTDWWLKGGSILESGVYTIRFIPQNNSNMTLRLGITNNNRKLMTNISSGNNISVSLNGWGYEYAKYQIHLNSGDLIEVSEPSDDNICLILVNSSNQLLSRNFGPIYTRVFSTGDYYLFIMSDDFLHSSSYSGIVQITTDSNLSTYPILSDINDQTIDQNQTVSLQLSASNNPTKFNVYGLPEGIKIDENSGLISGATATVGVFSVRAYVENEFGRDQQDFTLTVLGNDEFAGELPENIQSYLVLTENSVPFYFSPGSYVQAFGSEGVNTVNVEKYSRVQCKNFIDANEINIEEASSEFNVYRSGATVYLNSTSGTRIEIAATETPQTLKFADGSFELAIIAENVMLGSQLIEETESAVESILDSKTSSNIF